MTPLEVCAVSRRNFIRISSLSIAGLAAQGSLGMAAPAPSVAAFTPSLQGFGRAKHVILIFLQGGPSHIDIWDPKPEAPSAIRGPFAAIPTNVRGIYLSETMPKLARQMDKCALIRSVSYRPAGVHSHAAAIYHALTGTEPASVHASGRMESGPQDRSVDSGAGKNPRRSSASSLYVELPCPVEDSSGSTSAIRSTFSTASDARGLYSPDALAREFPGMDVCTALEIEREGAAARQRYGAGPFGAGVLAARRLVENGVGFIQVNWPAPADGDPHRGSWDTHSDNFSTLRNTLCPTLDAAVSALIEDLHDRGLLAETLVLAVGEFGRSPRIGVSTSGNFTASDGRDHWPGCYTALIAGAGIGGGQVYGESDATGSAPKLDLVTPMDLIATVHHAMGAGAAGMNADPILRLWS